MGWLLAVAAVGVCVCVCVRERERERERITGERRVLVEKYNIGGRFRKEMSRNRGAPTPR